MAVELEQEKERQKEQMRVPGWAPKWERMRALGWASKKVSA